jgi:chaperonin GroEL (HSP60 family)
MLESEALKTGGLEQYSIARFAQSFETIGRHLIENAGMKFNVVLPDLIAANSEGIKTGVDVLVSTY